MQRSDHNIHGSRMTMPGRGFSLLVTAAVFIYSGLWATDGLAQSDTTAAIIDTVGAEAAAAITDSTAMVVLHGHDLFSVGAQAYIGAERRATTLSKAIEEAARSPEIDPDDLRLVRDERVRATVIMAKDSFIGVVWDYEAAAIGRPTQEIAEERLALIQQAIIDYRVDFSSRSLIKGAIFAVITIVALVVALKLIAVVRRRIENMIESRLSGKTLFKVLEGESLVGLVKAVNRLVQVVLTIWLVLVSLNIVLSLFPWTAPIASQVFSMAVGPLKTFGQALVQQLPSFFFLAFIVFITVVILRGIGFLFREVGSGRIKFVGFHKDWSRPTFNLVRLVVIAFAIVLAIPYIPGSGSSAFKGMSLFVGLIVSLGSGGAMANIISGVILIYMRPFAMDDRVQIGETVGDVVDRNLLTTRLRTTKNERVTIPNSNILAGQVINFTSKLRTKELILHTSVTIGYDVPWRQVHELLLSAAAATETVMTDPEPFVLQKGLQDFYIEYELNVYTDHPRQIPATYSTLHENIQDAFVAAGVEILSPHYRVVRKDDTQAAAE